MFCYNFSFLVCEFKNKHLKHLKGYLSFSLPMSFSFIPFPLTLSTLISYSSFLFFFILSHLFSQSAPQILLLIEAHGLWVSWLSPDFLCLYTSLPVKSALCPCLCFSDDAQTSWITRSPLLPWILLLALQLA